MVLLVHHKSLYMVAEGDLLEVLSSRPSTMHSNYLHLLFSPPHSLAISTNTFSPSRPQTISLKLRLVLSTSNHLALSQFLPSVFALCISNTCHFLQMFVNINAEKVRAEVL